MSDDPNRTTGSDVRDDVNRAGNRLADDARSTAQSAMSQASSYAQDRAHDARDGVAGEVSDVASALRKAAESTRGGSFQEQAFQTLASTLADTADSLKSKEPGDMLAEVGRFARANPLAFLGVATLFGFAVSRVAGATSRPRTETSGYGGEQSYSPPAGASSAGVQPSPAVQTRPTGPGAPVSETTGATRQFGTTTKGGL